MTDRAEGASPAPADDRPIEDAAREVRIVRSRDGYRGFFRFEVVDLTHRRFDGEMSPVITREILHIPEAAAVLPYDPVTDSIVLIEQFRAGCMRHPTGAWLLEGVSLEVAEGSPGSSGRASARSRPRAASWSRRPGSRRGGSSRSPLMSPRPGR